MNVSIEYDKDYGVTNMIYDPEEGFELNMRRNAKRESYYPALQRSSKLFIEGNIGSTEEIENAFLTGAEIFAWTVMCSDLPEELAKDYLNNIKPHYPDGIIDKNIRSGERPASTIARLSNIAISESGRLGYISSAIALRYNHSQPHEAISARYGFGFASYMMEYGTDRQFEEFFQTDIR